MPQHFYPVATSHFPCSVAPLGCFSPDNGGFCFMFERWKPSMGSVQDTMLNDKQVCLYNQVQRWHRLRSAPEKEHYPVNANSSNCSLEKWAVTAACFYTTFGLQQSVSNPHLGMFVLYFDHQMNMIRFRLQRFTSCHIISWIMVYIVIFSELLLLSWRDDTAR